MYTLTVYNLTFSICDVFDDLIWALASWQSRFEFWIFLFDFAIRSRLFLSSVLLLFSHLISAHLLIFTSAYTLIFYIIISLLIFSYSLNITIFFRLLTIDCLNSLSNLSTINSIECVVFESLNRIIILFFQVFLFKPSLFDVTLSCDPTTFLVHQLAKS